MWYQEIELDLLHESLQGGRCGAMADMPGQWEATLSRGQVEIMVQEERKQEVKRAISAEGHVFREAVNRKRSHARSWEERVLSGNEQTRVGHGVPGERQ